MRSQSQFPWSSISFLSVSTSSRSPVTVADSCECWSLSTRSVASSCAMATLDFIRHLVAAARLRSRCEAATMLGVPPPPSLLLLLLLLLLMMMAATGGSSRWGWLSVCSRFADGGLLLVLLLFLGNDMARCGCCRRLSWPWAFGIEVRGDSGLLLASVAMTDLLLLEADACGRPFEPSSRASVVA